MSFANTLLAVFLTYYGFYFINLIKKRNREGIKTVNVAMDKFRKIPIKSLDEQKRFLNLRYPKTLPFKFRWKSVPRLLRNVLFFVIIFQTVLYLFSLGNVNLKLWQSIILVMTMPILINILLQKFNLQKSDIRVFLR